jgi:hypothetical protein
LPSASRLPIIVAMKFWFRIGPDQGNEQDGPQPPPSSCAQPAEKRADHFLRRGTARCARCSVADKRHPLANTRSIPPVVPPCQFQAQPSSPKASPTTEKRREIAQFSDISNRFWCKNRSYRKQKTKPCLTGARTHIRHFGFRALFANRFHASNRRSWLKTRRGKEASANSQGSGDAHLACASATEHGSRTPEHVRHPQRRTCAILAGETATNGLHRTYPE